MKGNFPLLFCSYSQAALGLHIACEEESFLASLVTRCGAPGRCRLPLYPSNLAERRDGHWGSRAATLIYKHSLVLCGNEGNMCAVWDVLKKMATMDCFLRCLGTPEFNWIRWLWIMMSPVIFPLFIPHLLPVSICQGRSVGGQNDTNKIKRGLRRLQSTAGTAGVTVTLNGKIDYQRTIQLKLGVIYCWANTPQRSILLKDLGWRQ